MASDMDPSDTIIKLIVTEPDGDTETLNVHSGILCKSSGFFQRAMKPEWARLREQPDTIDLPDDYAQTVSDYIKWLYSGNMPIKLYHAGKDTRERAMEEAQKVFVIIARAYVFGERILDTKYKNLMAETMLAATNSSGFDMGPKSVEIIYNGTPSTSSARRLVAHQVAYQAYYDGSEGEFGWMDFFDGYPREALVDAIKATIKIRPKPNKGFPEVHWYTEKDPEQLEER